MSKALPSDSIHDSSLASKGQRAAVRPWMRFGFIVLFLFASLTAQAQESSASDPEGPMPSPVDDADDATEILPALTKIEALCRQHVFPILEFTGPVVSGRVVNRQGQPVIARLAFRTQFGTGRERRVLNQAAFSNAEGKFEYRLPSEGRLTITAYSLNSEGTRTTTRLEMVVDSDFHRVPLVLDAVGSSDPSAITPRRVEMQFRSPEGFPPINGWVTVSATTRFWFGTQDVCIRDGRASFEVVARDRDIILQVSDLSAIGLMIAERETELRLPPEDAGVFEIETEPAGVVYGRVLDESGSPVSRARLRVVAEGGMPEWVSQTRSDDSGRYVVYPIPQETDFQIYVAADDETFRTTLTTASRCSVQDMVLAQDITLPDGVACFMRLVNDASEPQADTEVQLNWRDGQSGAMAHATLTTDQDGQVVLNGINQDLGGQYWVSIEARDESPAIQTDVRFAQGETTNVVVPRSRVIRGRLIDALTGEPIVGARLYVMAEPHVNNVASANSMTDSEGYFEVGGLLPVTYGVRFYQHHPPGSYRRMRPDGSFMVHIETTPEWGGHRAELPEDARVIEFRYLASEDLPIERD